MKVRDIEKLEKDAHQHVSDYHNLRPPKPMEVMSEDVLWMISEIKRLKKEKKRMLNSLQRWMDRKNKIKEDDASTKDTLAIQIVCLEDEVEMLRKNLDKQELKALAAQTILRKQKDKTRELQRKVKELINEKHPLPFDQLKNFELRTTNILLKSALRDLVMYSGRVIQEARHHKMHTVISVSMKNVLDALELGSGEEAIKALEVADKLDKEYGDEK